MFKYITQKDKILHFSICFIIAIIVSLITNITIGWVGAVIIGIIKELIDKIDYGLFDLKDLVADILGATAGILIIIFFNCIL